jgi:hypothetical protein
MLSFKEFLIFAMLTVILVLSAYIIEDEKVSLQLVISLLLIMNNLSSTNFLEKKIGENRIFTINSGLLLFATYIITKIALMTILLPNNASFNNGAKFFLFSSSIFGVIFGTLSHFFITYFVGLLLNLENFFLKAVRAILNSYFILIIGYFIVTVLNVIFLKGDATDINNNLLMKANRTILISSELLSIFHISTIYHGLGLSSSKSINLVCFTNLILGITCWLKYIL